jgi:hypothetical protein
MGKFMNFLNEEDLTKINAILDELSSEEIVDFGNYIYDEFFGDDDDDEDFDDLDGEFTLEDIQNMIAELGEEMWPEILDLLSDDMEDLEDLYDTEDFSEGVSRRLKVKNMNRKKRKFMKKSHAKLRKSKAQRKRVNRSTKAKRKRNYRKNKKKIQQYAKSRTVAISKGKHKVKLRKKAG